MPQHRTQFSEVRHVWSGGIGAGALAGLAVYRFMCRPHALAVSPSQIGAAPM